MSTTVQNVIDYALDRSALSDVQLINVPAAIGLIANEEKKAYIAAARLDPEYFGVSGLTTVRAAYTSSWSLNTVTPTGGAAGSVAAVSRVYVAAIVGTPPTGVTVGAKVNLVDSRWPNLDLAPRAYVRGRKIVPHSTELGTADAHMATQLTIWFSELPVAPATLASVLTLPDEWRDLIVLPLARMFCIRDHRAEEGGVFNEEYKALTQTFAEAVLSYGHGVRRPLPSVPAIPLGGGK